MARLKVVVCANKSNLARGPASKFHQAYRAYQRGEITHRELVARLPHVAAIGDSVCTSVYISSRWSTFWRARGSRGKNWFLDNDDAPGSILSVSKRLAEFTPFVAIECAGIGALVDGEDERQNFFRRVLGTRNFSGQVNRLLKAQRFPDLILISIGHNNVDWAWQCSPRELEQPETVLPQRCERFSHCFERQLRRLISGAQERRHRVAIVVYGLINFESYFKGREMAENRKRSNPALYPYLETTYKYIESFRPGYRRHLIRLAAMVNDEVCNIVSNLCRELELGTQVHLRYSDALATVDLSRVEFLHSIDGWHASPEGHNALAEAAFAALGPGLEFLGIGPPR